MPEETKLDELVDKYKKELDNSVRLYADTRTAAGQYAESLLQEHGISYSTIPTSGMLPIINGPGFMSFSFRCPTQREESK